ncbi:hypothetical protein J6590_077042 [Homalodisca vitripennis]|nr:hypothetical protein J6590_077042 [Homalodisca vitripennis]
MKVDQPQQEAAKRFTSKFAPWQNLDMVDFNTTEACISRLLLAQTRTKAAKFLYASVKSELVKNLKEIFSCKFGRMFSFWVYSGQHYLVSVASPSLRVRRVTASTRYTAPRNDATPLLREQSVTFIAPRNTMETIASSAKSAKFSEEEDELLVFEVQERHILWSLQQKEYKIVLKKDKEWELIGKKLSKTAGQTFELDETALPPPQQKVKKSSQEVGKKTKNQTTLVPPIPEDEVDLFFKSMAGTVNSHFNRLPK